MEDCIARIKEARLLLANALGRCDLPQIEAILRNADMELHWALWNLGEPVSLRPELDRAGGPEAINEGPAAFKHLA